MVLEHPLNISANFHLLLGVTEQVSHHAYMAGMRQLNQHDQIGTSILKGGMHLVPDPLPAIDAAARYDLCPSRFETQAAVADPLGTELPGTAESAALNAQHAFT